MNKQVYRHLTYRFIKQSFTILTGGLLLFLLSAPLASAEDAAKLLRLSGAKGGFIVHLGCGEGTLTARLRAGDQYFVHGLDTEATQVASARADLIEQGVYGPVSVDQWDGRHLPYADNLVNLIVAEEPAQLLWTAQGLYVGGCDFSVWHTASSCLAPGDTQGTRSG